MFPYCQSVSSKVMNALGSLPLSIRLKGLVPFLSSNLNIGICHAFGV